MNEPRGRPFAPGNTVGQGRPKGSRNKPKSPVQEMLDEFAVPLTRHCIYMASKGDRTAMRICMDRILPTLRDAPIRVSLPRLKTAQDLERSAERVIQAVGRGKIAPVEGERMLNIFETQARIIKDGRYESRLARLEESNAANDRHRRATEAPTQKQ